MSYDSIDPPLADRRIPAGGDFLSAQALAELPIGAQSLMKGDPVIPTEVTVL